MAGSSATADGPVDVTAEADDAFSDEELAALALAADPSLPLDPDAVPIDVFLAGEASLPSWYMAPVMARHSPRWRQGVILAVVGAFALIEAFGLCSTYGQFPFH